MFNVKDENIWTTLTDHIQRASANLVWVRVFLFMLLTLNMELGFVSKFCF